jgi:AbrB family looped-hinge helix DNA binding protein
MFKEVVMLTKIATITSKGQITIPKEVRQALQVKENDQLLFTIEGDRAVVTPLRRRPLTSFRGALPATRPYPGMEAIREELHRELGERIAKGEK